MDLDELNKLIKNRKINFNKLISYGFIKKYNFFEYSTNLYNNNFKLIVTFSENGNISTKVIDLETEDEFLLINVPSATGEYIGGLRNEYVNVLTDIYEKCSEIEVFKSDYTKQIISYIADKYGNSPEFLWKKYDNNAVFRHTDTKKWYAVLLTVSKNKLGFDSNEIVEIIDLRILPEDLEKIIDGEKFFPGYHMNKKHWLTIMLDGSVDIRDIFEFIDRSFEIK